MLEMERWRRSGRQIAFGDIELVDLGAKPGCLEFIIKVGLDQMPVVAPLMMMMALESWELFDARKGLKAPLTVASDGGRGALELRYRAKSREVQRNVCRDKREFAIMLVREADDCADHNDFRTVYRITKELACGRKYLDRLVKDFNGGLLIHDDEQQKG